MTATKPAAAFWELRETLLTRQADAVLTHAQLANVGEVVYGDSDLFRLYGLDLDTLTRRGFIVLGRTALECCVDVEGVRVARTVAKVWRRVAANRPGVVIDLFSGSANLLYWVTRGLHVPGVGFEVDGAVHRATRDNLMRRQAGVRLVHGSYTGLTSVADLDASSGRIYLVDPPWAQGFDPVTGLDLTRTEPRVDELFAWLRGNAVHTPTLVVLKVTENLSPTSVSWLRSMAGLRAVERISAVAAGVRTAFFVYELAGSDSGGSSHG